VSLDALEKSRVKSFSFFVGKVHEVILGFLKLTPRNGVAVVFIKGVEDSVGLAGGGRGHARDFHVISVDSDSVGSGSKCEGGNCGSHNEVFYSKELIIRSSDLLEVNINRPIIFTKIDALHIKR
jgi:hypothetical protein